MISATDQRIWPLLDPVQIRKQAEAELARSMARGRETLDDLSPDPTEDALLQVLAAAVAVQARDTADELRQMVRALNEAHQQALTQAEQHRQAKRAAQTARARFSALMEQETPLPAADM